jgi:hypothetical protein
VQGLLNQANGAGVTDEEAQAFAAKAAELMARHALDEAVVRADSGQKPEAIKTLRFEVSGQGWHGKGRAALVWRVALAYGCEAITEANLMNGKPRWVHIVGTTSAVNALELLLPSILLQAEANGAKATREHMAKVRDTYDTQANANIARRVFFRSYLPAFGEGVAEKIENARTKIAEEVANTTGALVLVTDRDRVKAAYEKQYPSRSKVPADSHDSAGATAGRRDGRNADTGQTRVGGEKKAVTDKATARKTTSRKPAAK